MKPGLEIGHTETIQVKVTPNMFAQFEGEVIHPAYSTVSMIYHMEWASRKILLPFLEEHEEGMGAAVSAKHVGASPVGSLLTVTAELIQYERNIVVTKVSIFRETKLVGIGEVKQVILLKQQINEMLQESSHPF
jgi:fluoroacetyl-CoA thioesterase